MVLRQGKHRNTSLIDDNDIRSACLAYLELKKLNLLMENLSQNGHWMNL